MQIVTNTFCPPEIKSALNLWIKNFYTELDLVCKQNRINNFFEWFTERTLLSAYLTGQIRMTESITSLQEYSVTDFDTESKGRCDAMLITGGHLWLLESKFQKKISTPSESHWEKEGWYKYDGRIHEQLKWYFDTDETFYLSENRYKKIILQSLVFKIILINKEKHLAEVTQNLSNSIYEDQNWQWYYSCYFPDYTSYEKIGVIKGFEKDFSIGLEVFGSVREIAK